MRVSRQYGNGSGQIWLDNVACRGNEEHIDNCTNRGWGTVRRCSHFEDVGVDCGPVLTESKH